MSTEATKIVKKLKENGRVKDITGQTFGRLTAREFLYTKEGHGAIWRCECSCGGEKEVAARKLLAKGRAAVRSCGCLTREMRDKQKVVGQKWGMLTAVEFSHYVKRPHSTQRQVWLFRCDCGTEKKIEMGNVRSGATRSCGCMQNPGIDISGERFGRLQAIRPTGKKDKYFNILWECQCDCGNTAIAATNFLRNGSIKSCGCLHREANQLKIGAPTEEMMATRLLATKVPSKANTSGTVGVSYSRRSGKWMAYIEYKGVKYRLGNFGEKQDAIEARQVAERLLHNPVISKHWDEIPEKKKKNFTQYLVEKEGLNEIEVQQKLIEINTLPEDDPMLKGIEQIRNKKKSNK